MRRLVVVTLGLLGAIVAGLIVFAVAAFTNATLSQAAFALAFFTLFVALTDWLLNAAGSDGELLYLLWPLALSIVAAPLLIAAVIGEALRVRSLLWYALCPGAVGAMVGWSWRRYPPVSLNTPPLRVESADSLALALFVAGAAAGLVYWLLAGRSTGKLRR